MMKFLMVAAAMALVSFSAQANDGGIAAIKVDKIRMRELSKDGYTEVKKLTNPAFKILIEGGEAEKLQKILPSTFSVFTTMYPDQEAAYNDTFKSLGIYSDGGDGATGKVIEIACSNGEIQGPIVVKTGKTECWIKINTPNAEMGTPREWFGDITTFEPKTCK